MAETQVAPATPATDTPQAPAPAPAPEAPRPAAKRTPGLVPKEAAKELFAQLDAEAERGAGGGKPAAPEPAPAKAESKAEPEPEAKGDAEGEPKIPEEELPQSLRQALKVIPDPKLRARIAADHFYLNKWKGLQNKHGGVSVDEVDGYVAYAKKAMEIAPTPEVLQEISQTADVAHQFAQEYTSGTPDGFSRFAGGLIQSNPKTFVDFMGFLLDNDRLIAHGLAENVHPRLAAEFKANRDRFMNRNNRNLVANLRKAGEKEGQEVLGEVAEELEKFLGFKKGQAEEPPTPAATPDERDQEIARLRSENERRFNQHVEAFNNSVFNNAGHALEKELAAWMDQKAAGLNDEARGLLAAETQKVVYEYLLDNKHINGRAARINQGGRYDKPHHDALAEFYIQQGRQYFPVVASRILARLRGLTQPAAQKRQERIERNQARKDFGAGGAVVTNREPTLKEAKTAKEMFELLDRQAEG